MSTRKIVIVAVLAAVVALTGVAIVVAQKSDAEQIERAFLEYHFGMEARDPARVCGNVSDDYREHLVVSLGIDTEARTCAEAVRNRRLPKRTAQQRRASANVQVTQLRIGPSNAFASLLRLNRCIVPPDAVFIREHGRWVIDRFIAGTENSKTRCYSPREVRRLKQPQQS